MTELEKLEQEVRKLRYRNALRIERNKRLRDVESPKFSEFTFGKAWGAYKALSTVLGFILRAKGEAGSEEELIVKDDEE